MQAVILLWSARHSPIYIYIYIYSNEVLHTVAALKLHLCICLLLQSVCLHDFLTVKRDIGDTSLYGFVLIESRQPAVQVWFGGIIFKGRFLLHTLLKGAEI